MQTVSINSVAISSIKVPSSSPNSKVLDGNLNNANYYWIALTTPSGKKTYYIAKFERHVPGHSVYLGKWELFGKSTKRYHNESIEVVREIKQPA